MKLTEQVKLISALLLLSFLLIGCAGLPSDRRAEKTASRKKAVSPEEAKEKELTSVQRRIVKGARKFVGAEELVVDGKKYRKDCTGSVAAVYAYAGIDILSPLADYSGNGVLRLYRFLKDKGLLVSADSPSAGDIIFWDNTYDKNEDGKPNDYLTHTGIVVSTGEDGTVVYYHHNYRKGTVLAKMNIHTPGVHTKTVDGERVVINSPMRMRGSPNFDKWLAAELLRSYGRAWRLAVKNN